MLLSKHNAKLLKKLQLSQLLATNECDFRYNLHEFRKKRQIDVVLSVKMSIFARK